MAAASAKDKESAAAAAAAAASQSGTKLSADMALALINMRNRDKNNYKILGAAAAGKKQPATAEVNSTGWCLCGLLDVCDTSASFALMYTVRF